MSRLGEGTAPWKTKKKLGVKIQLNGFNIYSISSPDKSQEFSNSKQESDMGFRHGIQRGFQKVRN